MKSETGTCTELAEDGDARSQRRSLTRQISRCLQVVVGVGLSATVACLVMYRTGARDEGPWYYLAILFGLPSALLAYIACFVRALDDFQ